MISTETQQILTLMQTYHRERVTNELTSQGLVISPILY